MPSSLEAYHQAVHFIESLSNTSNKNYFTERHGRNVFTKRMAAFMAALGNPQKKLRFIHVGGTSGKGSVSVMVQSILTAAGHKTGLYTSPFLTTTLEKMAIDGKFITPAKFVSIVEDLKLAMDYVYNATPYGHPSYFEICTAIALVHFAREKCDYVVLEVGMGGTYDATNVIDSPIAAVINTIDYDHVATLGNTIAQIASAKAGIIKKGTTVYTPSTNRQTAKKIFKETCSRVGANYKEIDAPKTPYTLAMPGVHQQHNAALAAAVARQLEIPEGAIRSGLSTAKLACRFEIMQRSPLVILDGAHNISKIKTTAAQLHHLTYKKLYLIIALTKERNPGAIFKNIDAKPHRIYVTRFSHPHRKCLPPKKLAVHLQKQYDVRVMLDARMALADALAEAGPQDAIVVTGSLYLCGELRSHWKDEAAIIKTLTM